MGVKQRRRHGKRGRIPKAVNIAKDRITEGMTPISRSALALYASSARALYIDPAEIEAQRLVDLEGLSQEEAGERMGVSRGTIWRLLQAARKKVIRSIIEGRPLLILDEADKETSVQP